MDIKLEDKNDKYEKMRKIMELKNSLTIEKLTEGLLPAVYEYFKYVRAMEFAAAPDYQYLRGLFKAVSKENNFEYDYKFDWIEKLKALKNPSPVEDVTK